MLRTVAAVVCLSIAACHRPPPASPPSPEPVVEADPPCDDAKVRSIARRYIPAVTSRTSHLLTSEMAYKQMVAEFELMTVKMRPYPRAMCWAKIELEVDLARIAAAKARGERLDQ